MRKAEEAKGTGAELCGRNAPGRGGVKRSERTERKPKGAEAALRFSGKSPSGSDRKTNGTRQEVSVEVESERFEKEAGGGQRCLSAGQCQEETRLGFRCSNKKESPLPGHGRGLVKRLRLNYETS